jgi:hypothetical protein
MASLYEIEQSMLECLDLETGEVIDTEMLDALRMERTAKLESVALWIKNLESDVEAYKAEMESFAARRKAAEHKIESLKDYLSNALGGEKFSTAKCAVSFRRSEKVEILNEDHFRSWAVKNHRPDLLTIAEPKISLTAVKNALKDGELLYGSGAELVQRNNIQIK